MLKWFHRIWLNKYYHFIIIMNTNESSSWWILISWFFYINVYALFFLWLFCLQCLTFINRVLFIISSYLTWIFIFLKQFLLSLWVHDFYFVATYFIISIVCLFSNQLFSSDFNASIQFSLATISYHYQECSN